MTATPTVTIVLPTYNGECYLAQAIESCLSQTLSDWELIVVDDASTDGTPEIIAGFCARDARIRSVRHQVNRKLPGALNTGFALAKGNLLTWTSDDNSYRPSALQTMLEFLGHHPEVDAVYTDYTVIDDCDTVTEQIRVLDPVYLVRENVAGPCFLYRRTVHECVGSYDEELFLVEDYDFWLRVAARFHMMPLHQDLYLYRRHQSSLSNLYRQRVLENRETTIRNNLPRLGWVPADATVAGWLLVAVMARRRGAYSACLSGIWQALRISPVLALTLIVRMLLGGINGPKVIGRLEFDTSRSDIPKVSA